jgi:hypothetical protein
VGAILQLPCPSVHTFVTVISASTARNDLIFDIWLWHGDLYRVSPFQVYRTSASRLQCDLELLPSSEVNIESCPHIYFLFTVRLRIFHVCRNENFRNSYLSFYWKKWSYIWYMALAWWLVPCLPFPGLPHIYFLLPCDLQMNVWGYS